MKAWAVMEKHQGKWRIVVSASIFNPSDEAVEVHRTRKLAEGARMNGERVVRVEIRVLRSKHV